MNVTGTKFKKINAEAQNTKSLWHIPKPDTRVHLNENVINDGVKKGTIFGLISVDIHTPENLKEQFS